LREQELRRQIDEFVKDDKRQVLEFPKSLNSWERQVIHAYCDSI